VQIPGFPEMQFGLSCRDSRFVYPISGEPLKEQIYIWCSVLDSIGMGLERQLLEGAYANSSKAVLAFGTIDLKPVRYVGQSFFFMRFKNETDADTS